jgi:6-phosphogluconolactonase/glucosamine-6-phosphate isomerase/deaminase
MTINVYEKTHADRAAGVKLEQEIKETDAPVLLLCSGGSALSMLKYINFSKKAVTVTALDERFSPDQSKRNFPAIKSAFSECNPSFLDPYSKEKSVTQAGNDFSKILKDWIQSHPDGKVLATFGIGKDGHTAGIMPQENKTQFQTQFCGDDFAVGLDLPASQYEHPKRITTTKTFFERIDHGYVLAVGKKKTPVLKKLFAENHSQTIMPAQILHELPVDLYTDQIIS